MEGLLAPARLTCSACNALYTASSGELPLCRSCTEAIPWILDVRCERCGRPELCIDCYRRKDAHFIQNRSVVSYTPKMKEWLGQYKYRGDEKMRSLLGFMLVHAYHLHAQQPHRTVAESGVLEFITYVPLSDKRLSERGFNQARQLAEELGRRTGIPVVDLLQRVRHTDKQSFKTRGERMEDLQGVFSVLPSAKNELYQLFLQSSVRLYVVDDVYTTGSTLNECAKAIKKELKTEVYGINWAR